ncbi:IS1595 family transposase [Iodobacter sp. CM08]|nr:IS1595 family transposase [Iodobacter sp. CM08]MDW5419299.1 IS1595 family transposase [Iodobacter sp. CM08]
MKSSVFHEWMKSLPQLSHVQRIHLLEALNLSINQDEIASSLEENNVPQCNRCGGSHYYRWGRQAGLQRYRCRDCRHTYTVLSGTPLARLRHKDQWLQYSKALIQGLTVRAAATECGVHKNTSFRWRHRFLTLPSRLKPRLLQGIVEADETYFPLSFKGSRHLPRPVHRRGHALRKKGTGKDQVPVLVLRNRQGVTTDFKLLVANTKSIEPVLSAVLAPDVMLCSDGAAAYRLATAHLGLSHCAVNLSQGIRVRGAYHVQNVNAYDSRLKNWMTRFHGVATKYLESYLGWRRWLDRAGQNITAKSGIEQAIGKNILFNY